MLLKSPSWEIHNHPNEFTLNFPFQILNKCILMGRCGARGREISHKAESLLVFLWHRARGKQSSWRKSNCQVRSPVEMWSRGIHHLHLLASHHQGPAQSPLFSEAFSAALDPQSHPVFTIHEIFGLTIIIWFTRPISLQALFIQSLDTCCGYSVQSPRDTMWIKYSLCPQIRSQSSRGRGETGQH